MSLFKFKKAKVMVGDFDPDDEDEWTLLIKPQIQDVTLFVHLHKQWNVVEVPGTPEIEADEANGIEYQEATPGIMKIPVVHVFTGFVKDGNFVLDKDKAFSHSSFEGVKKDYLKRLQTYTELGFTKDWDMYEHDIGLKPKYYGEGRDINSISNISQAINQSIHQSGGIVQAQTANINTTKKLFKHIFLKGGNQLKQSSNP